MISGNVLVIGNFSNIFFSPNHHDHDHHLWNWPPSLGQLPWVKRLTVRPPRQSCWVSKIPPNDPDVRYTASQGKDDIDWHWVAGWQLESDILGDIEWDWVCGRWNAAKECGQVAAKGQSTMHHSPHGERAVNAETNMELSPFLLWIQESGYPINQLKVKQTKNIFLLLLNPTPRIPHSFSSSPLLVRHKKSGWLKFGNEKNYRTSSL